VVPGHPWKIQPIRITISRQRCIKQHLLAVIRTVETSPGSTSATPPPVLTAEQRVIVDEFGDLDNERKAWARKEKRLKAVRATIQSWYPALAADKTELAVGTRYEVQIGERSVEKDWASLDAVQKALGGWRKLRAICQVTFDAVQDVLGKKAAESLQVEAQTGWRKLTAVAIVSVPCARVLPDAELPKAA
jgi:hypothetical protein